MTLFNNCFILEKNEFCANPSLNESLANHNLVVLKKRKQMNVEHKEQTRNEMHGSFNKRHEVSLHFVCDQLQN